MKIKSTLFALGIAVVSINSMAAEISCDGKIELLAYHSSHGMMVKLDSMNHPVFFCDPDNLWEVSGTGYKTGPETCKTIYSSLLTAQSLDKTVHSMWFDGDNVPATCDGWDKWKHVNMRYFGLYRNQ